jgi:hypothetical protein
MTPRTSPKPAAKRASLFPAYVPPDDDTPPHEHFAAYVETVARRVLLAGSVLALIAAGGGFLGFGVLGPKQTASKVTTLEDSARVHSKRISDLESLVRTNLYISCEVLTKIQPPGSIPPQECRR